MGLWERSPLVPLLTPFDVCLFCRTPCCICYSVGQRESHSSRHRVSRIGFSFLPFTRDAFVGLLAMVTVGELKVKKEPGKARSDFYYEVSKLLGVYVAGKDKVGATFLDFLSFYRV